MLTTTLTTAICLFCTAFSPIPTVKAFGMFGSLLIVVDYVQVITWFPAVVLMREKYCPCLTRLTPIKRCVLEEGQERWITIFLRDRLAPLMRRYRFVLVAAAVVVAAGSGAVYATMFKPADKIPLFKRSHPFEEMLRIQWEEFHNSRDWKIEVTLVYGLQTTPISYLATTQILPAEYGANDEHQQLQWDAAFDLTPAVQEAIVAHCEAAAADAELVPSGEVYCLLRELKAWLGDGGFPLATEAALRRSLEEFAVSDAMAYLEGNHTQWAMASGWVADGDEGIMAMWNTFNTTIPLAAVTGAVFGGNVEILKPWHAKWEAWAEEQCGGGPVRCYQTVRYYVFMSLLKARSPSQNLRRISRHLHLISAHPSVRR